MKRVVLDCNVLISASLTKGTCRQVVRRVLESAFLIVSPDVEREYREVFQRPKFQAAYTEFQPILEDLLATAFYFEPVPCLWLSPDPKDQRYLDVAVAAQADFLVTGNTKHFLPNRAFTLQIVTPADYLRCCEKYTHHEWVFRRDARPWRAPSALRLLAIEPGMIRRRALTANTRDAPRLPEKPFAMGINNHKAPLWIPGAKIG